MKYRLNASFFNFTPNFLCSCGINGVGNLQSNSTNIWISVCLIYAQKSFKRAIYMSFLSFTHGSGLNWFFTFFTGFWTNDWCTFSWNENYGNNKLYIRLKYKKKAVDQYLHLCGSVVATAILTKKWKNTSQNEKYTFAVLTQACPMSTPHSYPLASAINQNKFQFQQIYMGKAHISIYSFLLLDHNWIIAIGNISTCHWQYVCSGVAPTSAPFFSLHFATILTVACSNNS